MDSALKNINGRLEWLEEHGLHFRLDETTGTALIVWRGGRHALGGGNGGGEQGPPGTPGSKWLFGTGAPAGALGANGDFYLDTANGDVHNKSVGSWTLIDNLTGPVGATGPAGPPGSGGGGGGAGSLAEISVLGFN